MILLIDLESIQDKLSSDHSLNICFSRRFPHIDDPSYSPYKPLKKFMFGRLVTCGFFSRIILTC